MNAWRPIPGFEDRYHINSAGEVLRVQTGHTMTPFPCHGDLRLYLRKHGHRVGFSIPRLVAKLFIGEPPNRTDSVEHIDGNKRNCHVENLRWKSRSQVRREACAALKVKRGQMPVRSFDPALFNRLLGIGRPKANDASAKTGFR